MCFSLFEYFLILSCTQNEEVFLMESGVEQAGTKSLPESEISEDDFDPWALPELQEHGPKWEGKRR